MMKTPKAIAAKAKLDKWDLSKEFLHIKKKLSINRQPAEWEKLFANYASDKNLIPRIYKEHKQINKSKNNPLKSGQRT